MSNDKNNENTYKNVTLRKIITCDVHTTLSEYIYIELYVVFQ